MMHHKRTELVFSEFFFYLAPSFGLLLLPDLSFECCKTFQKWGMGVMPRREQPGMKEWLALVRLTNAENAIEADAIQVVGGLNHLSATGNPRLSLFNFNKAAINSFPDKERPSKRKQWRIISIPMEILNAQSFYHIVLY